MMMMMMMITINQKILNYILYKIIQSKDEESFVKQAFLISFDLHCNGKNNFHSHLMNMSAVNTLRFLHLTSDLLDIAMVKSYLSSMKQEFLSYRQNTLQHSQKVEFYRSFKSNHTTSSYLDLTRGTAGGRALVTLRTSNHKLIIKIGRCNQTTKDNRHRSFCGSNVIEDEVHFLFQCPTYSMIRNKFYYKVKTLIPNITELPINGLICGLINELMNSSNYLEESKKNLFQAKKQNMWKWKSARPTNTRKAGCAHAVISDIIQRMPCTGCYLSTVFVFQTIRARIRYE